MQGLQQLLPAPVDHHMDAVRRKDAQLHCGALGVPVVGRRDEGGNVLLVFSIPRRVQKSGLHLQCLGGN
jgi:hypothetical protein